MIAARDAGSAGNARCGNEQTRARPSLKVYNSVKITGTTSFAVAGIDSPAVEVEAAMHGCARHSSAAIKPSIVSLQAVRPQLDRCTNSCTRLHIAIRKRQHYQLQQQLRPDPRHISGICMQAPHVSRVHRLISRWQGKARTQALCTSVIKYWPGRCCADNELRELRALSLVHSHQLHTTLLHRSRPDRCSEQQTCHQNVHAPDELVSSEIAASQCSQAGLGATWHLPTSNRRLGARKYSTLACPSPTRVTRGHKRSCLCAGSFKDAEQAKVITESSTVSLKVFCSNLTAHPSGAASDPAGQPCERDQRHKLYNVARAARLAGSARQCIWTRLDSIDS